MKDFKHGETVRYHGPESVQTVFFIGLTPVVSPQQTAVVHFPMTGVREVPLATLEPVPKTRLITVPLPVHCAQDGCRVTLEFSDPIAASELAQAVKP